MTVEILAQYCRHNWGYEQANRVPGAGFTKILMVEVIEDAVVQQAQQATPKSCSIPREQTQAFQGFFSGQGQVVMKIDVSQLANIFYETLQTLKYYEKAKQITVICEEKTSIGWGSQEAMANMFQEEYYQDLEQVNSELLQQGAERHSKTPRAKEKYSLKKEVKELKKLATLQAEEINNLKRMSTSETLHQQPQPQHPPRPAPKLDVPGVQYQIPAELLPPLLYTPPPKEMAKQHSPQAGCNTSISSVLYQEEDVTPDVSDMFHENYPSPQYLLPQIYITSPQHANHPP